MTEQYLNFDYCTLQNMCRLCLSTNIERPMNSEEINWYQSVISKTPASAPMFKLNICLVCSHFLKKYTRFYHYCQYSQDILDQCMEQGTILDFTNINRQLHNFVQTQTKTINIDPENLFIDDKDSFDAKYDLYVNPDDGAASEKAIDDDDDDDDDTPLMMLSKSVYLKQDKRGKKRKKKPISDLKENEKQEKGEEVEVLAGKSKRRKELREGFSSRMVQETEEYIVIKLTKEQVLEEMRELSASEKYQRALYKCELCVQGFNFEDVLSTHMEKHNEKQGWLQCDMCSQYCPSAVSLRGHIKSHTTRYKCKICGCVRRARQHLLEHHAGHTRAARSYSCHHCSFTTDKRTVIQRHVRSHRQSERHACEQCGRLFRTVESLRVHTTRHDKSRSLRCGECGRGFLYPSLLATHRARVHLHTDYYCVECDVRFKSPDNLRLHFKKAKRHRDSSSYNYECRECSARFVSSSSLSVHLSAMHGSCGRFPCVVCGRLYSSRESLRAHCRRTHRGMQPEGADTNNITNLR